MVRTDIPVSNVEQIFLLAAKALVLVCQKIGFDVHVAKLYPLALTSSFYKFSDSRYLTLHM